MKNGPHLPQGLNHLSVMELVTDPCSLDILTSGICYSVGGAIIEYNCVFCAELHFTRPEFE